MKPGLKKWGRGLRAESRPLVELLFQMWSLTDRDESPPRAVSLASLRCGHLIHQLSHSKINFIKPPPAPSPPPSPKSPHRVWLAHVSPTWLRVAAGSARSRKWKRTTSLWDDWPINHWPFSINHGRWRGTRQRLVGHGCSPRAWWEGPALRLAKAGSLPARGGGRREVWWSESPDEI